jgi:HK97 family phage portal protein
MNLFGWQLSRETKTAQFETVLRQLISAANGTVAAVTPETCMRSPTVQAIVTAISRRIAVSPVQVFEKSQSGNLDIKKKLPDHPVAKLLNAPNDWQTRTTYWLDAVSCFVRYGNYYAWKSRGSTGPIRKLYPLHARGMSPEQDENFNLVYKYNQAGGLKEYAPASIHHVRGAARNFVVGDSPVDDIKLSIALEIAAEELGATFFANGAMPLMVFKYATGAQGFRKPEDETQFITDFQAALGGNKRHKALLLPKGIETSESPNVENDKAQFLETRKYQRTVIAGAFGVPPHLVGDLERATFNNVEQQDIDFTSNVIQPVCQSFESAMERDLLTDEDRRRGVIIRFNLDSILRSDFKSRQEGLRIQRDSGVLSPNEWREIERMNPISDEDGGGDYVRPANFVVAGAEPIVPVKPAETDTMKPMNDALAKLRKAAESLT